MHTRQWIGTYSGKGNGDYRGELASALQAITTYLTHFAFTPEMALVRLDGQYGDAAVIAQVMQAGVYLVTRGRGYQLLERPQIQRVLAHPPIASVTRMNTGEVVALFDGGWLELGEGLPQVRVIVARHPAPPPGKRVDEWVYELFITTLDARSGSWSRMSWICIMDGGHSRRCLPMKMSKKIQIGGVPTPSVGKNSGKSLVNGCGICASRLAMRCKQVRYATSSGHHPKNVHHSSRLQRTHPRCTAPGSGPEMGDERAVVSRPAPSHVPREWNPALSSGVEPLAKLTASREYLYPTRRLRRLSGRLSGMSAA